jgi:hypothetical protein
MGVPDIVQLFIALKISIEELRTLKIILKMKVKYRI